MRSTDLRTGNRYRLVAGLRRHGTATRAELGRLTGLSPAAVSTLTGQLYESGVVISTPRAVVGRQRRGRPETTISLAASAARVVTVSLTIDRLRLRLIHYDGTVACDTTQHIDTRSLSAQQLIERLIQSIENLLPERGTRDIEQISIGFQGMTETTRGTLVWSPILGIRDVPVGRLLGERFQTPVNVHHDCRLIAAALHHQQRPELSDNFVTLLFSHGVGMSLSINGKPFPGVRTSAMEIGHVNHVRGGARCRCGLQGCIEAYAADYAIVRRAEGQPGSTPPTGHVAKERFTRQLARADAGDATALAAFAEAGAAVGHGLATLFRLFDPLPVVLVGHVTAGLDHMHDALSRSIDEALGIPGAHRNLLHVVSDEEPLMQAGLALDALDSADRRLASGKPAGTAPAGHVHTPSALR